MRILVVGKFYPEGFAQHILETLLKLGHQAEAYQPGYPLYETKGKYAYRFRMAQHLLLDVYSRTSAYRKWSQSRLKRLVETRYFDFIICCHDFLTPFEIELLKRQTGATIVLWFPDAISNFGRAMFLDAPYDALFFKEPFVVNILRSELQKRAYYLPECCNPDYHNKVVLSEEDLRKYSCDITTAGNMHSARSATFKFLNEYNVKIWGNPAPQWMNIAPLREMIQDEYVSNIKKAKAFGAASIVLNNIHPTEIFGVNVRMFEIAACGGFQISGWRSGLTDLFTEGEEIVCYRSIPELKSKVSEYLSNPSKRKIISDAGYRRAHSQHTYQHRLQLMISTMNGNVEGFPIPV